MRLMDTAILCLLGYAAWTILLVLMVVSWRGVMVLQGTYKTHGFPSGTPHGPDVYWRLNRSHINAAEELPVFAVVVLAGAFTGVNDPLFGTLAAVVLGARVFQTLVHVAAHTAVSVSIRVTALLVQLVAAGWMLVIVAKGLL